MGTKLASSLVGPGRPTSRVRVIVEARPGHAKDAQAATTRVGGRLEARYHDLVQALVPASSLERLAASSDVSLVRPPLLHVPAAATGQEIAASGADIYQAAGVTGRGVKIAVLDVGFAGERAAVASGDLPQTTSLNANGCKDSTASSHGTAVAEIVHEMAPDAELFLVCVDSEVTLGKAVDWVINQGIPVINHSVTWLSGGRGDGVHNRLDRISPDDLAKKAFDNGVLWVGAAGNFGQSHWSGTFADLNGDGWENFSGSDEGNDLTIRRGERVCASLVWDDWPTSTQDYDLYLYRKDHTELASSQDRQRPSHPGAPSEEACYVNDSSSALPAYVGIRKVHGTLSPRLDLFVTEGTLQYNVPQGSVAEPAESPWVLAVGAVCWLDSSVRAYSSEGPTIDGRIKPDIVGYDGVSTSTFGPSSGCSGGFLGTSAATPAVAGAAALLLQQSPALSGKPAKLMSALESKTVDLGGHGKDNLFGWGRLCLSTCAVSQPPPPPPPPPAPPPAPPLRLALTRFVTFPTHSKAGRSFAALIAVTRTDTGARVSAGKVVCPARVGQKRIRLLRAGFRRKMARCAWRIPASAKRKLLRGSVTLKYRGLRVRRSFRQRVRSS